MEDYLDLRRIDPTYRVRFDDGVQIALSSDLTAMQQQLEAIEPGSFHGLLRYLAEGHTHYRLALDRFVGRNFDSLLDYFSPRNLPLLFQLKALAKHYHNVGRFFHDPHLKAAFTFQNMYLGLSPYDAPATYSLLQYAELARGVWFPSGGLYRVVESLVEIAEAHGVRFQYDTAVKQIDVGAGRAAGVLLENGERLRADAIVANADLPYVYDRLLPDRAAAERLEHLDYTCSAIMFYWGTDRVYPQLGTHNVFLCGDYRASFERIFKDRTLPDNPSFYVHAPARTDPTAAPAGGDTLMVLVPAGHLDDTAGQDWEMLRARARAAVLRRLAAIGIADLDAHLRCEASYTARDWRAHYNLAKGAAFGLSHTFWQVGYLRPQNRHRRYRNLYFVGSSTHPGTGMPIVLLSARLTTERMLRDLGTPHLAVSADALPQPSVK
jgi:phytoene desaturase